MRKPLIVCIVLVIGAALTATLALAATPAPRTVKVGDNWFVKDTDGVPKITVKRNTTVRFHFVGDDVHNVFGYRGSTSGTPKFKSSFKDSGYYKRKLSTTGTYTIVCDIHGQDDQSMKIKVTS